jgi:YHS domain-containing protein
VTPLRLVIISVLLYIVYRLLVGPRKKKEDAQKTAASSNSAVQDVLAEDPVCHTYIPKGQAVQLHHDKKMYYFCSDKCCEMFLKQKGAEE